MGMLGKLSGCFHDLMNNSQPAKESQMQYTFTLPMDPCSKEKQNVSRNAVKEGVDIFRLQVYSKVLSNRVEQLELPRCDDFHGGIPLRSAWGSSLTHQSSTMIFHSAWRMLDPWPPLIHSTSCSRSRKLPSELKIVVPWIDSLVCLSLLSLQHSGVDGGNRKMYVYACASPIDWRRDAKVPELSPSSILRYCSRLDSSIGIDVSASPGRLRGCHGGI